MHQGHSPLPTPCQPGSMILFGFSNTHPCRNPVHVADEQWHLKSDSRLCLVGILGRRAFLAYTEQALEHCWLYGFFTSIFSLDGEQPKGQRRKSESTHGTSNTMEWRICTKYRSGPRTEKIPLSSHEIKGKETPTTTILLLNYLAGLPSGRCKRMILMIDYIMKTQKCTSEPSYSVDKSPYKSCFL